MKEKNNKNIQEKEMNLKEYARDLTENINSKFQKSNKKMECHHLG